jgi:hypothetical protein
MAYGSFPKTVTRTSNPAVSNVSGQFTAELRSLIQPGRVIRGDHIAKLRNAINSLRNHTHTYVDFSMIGEFGNGAGRGDATRSVTRTTTASNASAPSVLDLEIGAGSRIRTTHFNALASSANSLRTHRHTYTDFYQQETL